MVGAILAHRALGPADAGRGWGTGTRTGPIDFAISTALTMSSVLVTSTLAKAPPISSASARPLSSCRSATTTFAPRSASILAAAAPIPDAPPVTIALAPVISMAADGADRLAGDHNRVRTICAL